MNIVLSSIRRVSTAIRDFFRFKSVKILSYFLAFIALIAYSSDVFMDAQLVFTALGVAGPWLLGACVIMAVLVGAAYLLQEANNIVELLQKLRPATVWSNFKWFFKRDESSYQPLSQDDALIPEADPQVVGPRSAIRSSSVRLAVAHTTTQAKALTVGEKTAYGGGLLTASIIAGGTAGFFALTAFFGVVTLATLFGASLASPPVLGCAILAAVVQAMASFSQEGWNSFTKLVFEPMKTRLGIKKTRGISVLYQKLFAKPVKLSPAPTAPAIHITLLNGKIVGAPQLPFDAGLPLVDSNDSIVAEERLGLLPEDSQLKAKKTWRSYLPLLMGWIFGLIALCANLGDTFMEAQLIFGSIGGMSLGIGFPILCITVAAIVGFTYFSQEGRAVKANVRAGCQAIWRWLSGAAAQDESLQDANTPLHWARTKKLMGGLIVILAASFGGIGAFFGVMSICVALGAVAFAPWILVLAGIAGIAQFWASTTTEGKQFLQWVLRLKVNDEPAESPLSSPTDTTISANVDANVDASVDDIDARMPAPVEVVAVQAAPIEAAAVLPPLAMAALPASVDTFIATVEPPPARAVVIPAQVTVTTPIRPHRTAVHSAVTIISSGAEKPASASDALSVFVASPASNGRPRSHSLSDPAICVSPIGSSASGATRKLIFDRPESEGIPMPTAALIAASSPTNTIRSRSASLDRISNKHRSIDKLALPTEPKSRCGREETIRASSLRRIAV